MPAWEYVGSDSDPVIALAITVGVVAVTPIEAIDVLPGPDLDQFPDFAADVARTSFTVDTNSDHVGVRLQGPSFTRAITTEILSRGVPLGAVEQPPTGGPIILMRGRPLTAGYPVPVVVARSSHSALGQLRPGDTVTLRMTTASWSTHLLRTKEEQLDNLRKRCQGMFQAGRLFPSHSSTSQPSTLPATTQWLPIREETP